MTDKSPCDWIFGIMSICRSEIVAAAKDRAKAQALLEEAARDGAPSWTMRQRQRAVNQADRRISEAANTMLAAEMLAPVLR